MVWWYDSATWFGGMVRGMVRGYGSGYGSRVWFEGMARGCGSSMSNLP